MRWRWVVSFTSPAALPPQEETPPTIWIKDWDINDIYPCTSIHCNDQNVTNTVWGASVVFTATAITIVIGIMVITLCYCDRNSRSELKLAKSNNTIYAFHILPQNNIEGLRTQECALQCASVNMSQTLRLQSLSAAARSVLLKRPCQTKAADPKELRYLCQCRNYFSESVSFFFSDFDDVHIQLRIN